jgi:hypothetical protein
VSQKYLYVAAYLSIGHRQQAIVQLLKALPVFLQLLKGSMFFSRLLPSVPLYKWGVLFRYSPSRVGGFWSHLPL